MKISSRKRLAWKVLIIISTIDIGVSLVDRIPIGVTPLMDYAMNVELIIGNRNPIR